MTKIEIRDICEEYEIENYIINPDGSIDVDGDVNLSSKDLYEIPLKFNYVSGYFDCSNNMLTSLENCPKEVGGNFNCPFNKITSLINSPKQINGYFDCSYNNLNTLNGIINVKGILFCSRNRLQSLDGYNKYDYDKLIYYDQNRELLIKKHKRRTKLKIIENL